MRKKLKILYDTMEKGWNSLIILQFWGILDKKSINIFGVKNLWLLSGFWEKIDDYRLGDIFVQIKKPFDNSLQK